MDLKLPTDEAVGYKSASQIARVTTEAWVESQLPCPACSAQLRRLAANAKTRDFECSGCHESFQLKSQSRSFGKRVVGAAYRPTIDAIASHTHPHLLLLHYDRQLMKVISVTAIHRSALTRRVVKPRRPLSENARRAGWQGCIFHLDFLPSQAVVRLVDHGRPIQVECDRFNQIPRAAGIDGADGAGWIADVLACVQLLPEEFTLQQMYRFERDLTDSHPENRNIKAKVRQQLQVLRDFGFIEFVESGLYRRIDDRVG